MKSKAGGKKKEKERSEKKRKERKSLAERIYESRIGSLFKKDQTLGKSLRALSPKKKAEELEKAYWIRQIRIFLSLAAGIGVLLLLVAVYGAGNKGEVTSLRRRGAGEGNYTEEMQVEEEGGEKETLSVEVLEKKLTEEEVYALFEKSGEELEEAFLGENASADRIEYPLSLAKTAADGLISVEWSFDNYQVLNPDGSIRAEKTSEAGTQVEVRARMTYREQEAERIFTIMVYPPHLSEKEAFAEDLRTALEGAEEKSSEEDLRELPTEANGRRLTWFKGEEHLWLKILLFGIVILFAFLYEERQKVKRGLEEREKQLKMDYAQIVNQIAILTGAGMPVFRAWERIVKEYERKEGERRYAYEEMQLSYNRIREGESEISAYEKFGENCGLREYRRLTLLLNRNIKLGAAGMGALLEREAAESFEERKARARARGEEAGTKLLLPMMIYLMVVVLIVVLPGFISFAGI